MTDDILFVSKLLSGKQLRPVRITKNTCACQTNRPCYMDPPYQGVCATGDPRCFSGIDFDNSCGNWKNLINETCLLFSVTMGGREKSYGQSLPEELDMYRLEIDAGVHTGNFARQGWSHYWVCLSIQKPGRTIGNWANPYSRKERLVSPLFLSSKLPEYLMAKTSKQNKEIKRLLKQISNKRFALLLNIFLRTDLSLQKNSKEIWL